MRKSELALQQTDPGLLRVTMIIAGLFLLVAFVNISQTSMTQWQPRPNISCDNGEPVHRAAHGSNLTHSLEIGADFDNTFSNWFEI